MVFTDRGLALRRVHGCLVVDDEIHSVVAFLKTQGIVGPPDVTGKREVLASRLSA